MRLLVIIPAYNEAENLPIVVRDIEGYDYIIINDGSSDDTKKLPYPMINLEKNHGVGYAMRVGYKYAYENGYDYAVQIDGDYQHNPAFIPTLLNENADMVIGSRFINKEIGKTYKAKSGCVFRCLGIRYIRGLIKKHTGKTITDPTSGMRLVNRKIMKLFSEYYPTTAAEPISVYSLLLNNFSVKEVPVEMRKRMNGKSFVNLKNILKYMKAVTEGIKNAR